MDKWTERLPELMDDHAMFLCLLGTGLTATELLAIRTSASRTLISAAVPSGPYRFEVPLFVGAGW